MEKTPEISVVMATRNRQDYLGEAITSVLNQSYNNFEFIIVDDASSDNTYSILNSYQSKDSRIKVIRNDCHKGISFSRNKGFDISRGKYIAVMDDDDIAIFNRFQTELDYLDNNKDIAVVASNIEVFQTGSVTKNNVPFYIKSWVKSLSCNLVPIMMILNNYICHSSVMMRKEFLLSKNISYNEDIPCCVDYDLWVKIIFNGGKISILNDVLQKYRVHSQCITTVKSSRMIQNELAEKLKIKQLEVFFDSKHDAQMYFMIFKKLSDIEKLKQIKFLNEAKRIFCDADINECIANATILSHSLKDEQTIKDSVRSLQCADRLHFVCDHLWYYRLLKLRFWLCKCLSWGRRRDKYRMKYKAVRDLLREAKTFRRNIWQDFAQKP